MSDASNTPEDYNSDIKPPTLATLLLKWFCPKDLESCLLGDLLEEYYDRVEDNMGNANQWYWKQAFTNSVHYTSKVLASEKFLQIFVVLISLILLSTLTLVLSWMSNMDTVDADTWSQLTRGEVHNLMFKASVLYFGVQKFFSAFDILLYQNAPGFSWAFLSFIVLYFRDRYETLSAHQLAGWGYTLMFLPYVFGLIYIDFMRPDPKNIGPTLAFMIFPIIYMLAPLGYWVFRRVKK